MQITIDLSDIFCSENDPCDLQEAIKQEVVRHITATLTKGLHLQVSQEVTRIMDEEIAAAVKAQIPSILEELFDFEYTPIDRYGSRNKPTTFRNELIAKVNEEMVYKPQSYETQENIFTRAVRGIVKEQIDTFKKGFDKKVDAAFIAEVHTYAIKTLAKKLGVLT
jgi:uncharacterized protein (DUF2267 family)